MYSIEIDNLLTWIDNIFKVVEKDPTFVYLVHLEELERLQFKWQKPKR